MEFGKRHDTLTDTNNGLLSAPTCYTDLLWGNWCNGFWTLSSNVRVFNDHGRHFNGAL